MSDWPSLELKALLDLLAIKEKMDVNPTSLDASGYQPEIQAALRTLFEVRVETVLGVTGEGAKDRMKRGPKAKGELSDAQAEIVQQEAEQLLKDLKDLKPPAGGKFDHDTKIQIIKAKTALIEKVVNIQERAFNVRKVANFQKVVIDILAEIVDPDRIKEFQDRLGAYL